MEEGAHLREQPRYRGGSPRVFTYKPSTSPSLRGLLDPDAVDAWSRQVKLKGGSISPPSRFGSSRAGTQVPENILLAFFALLACVRWLSGRGATTAGQQSPLHRHLEPRGRPNASDGNYVAVKYAAKPTIRQGLRTSTGSRAKHREKTVVFGLSSHPEEDRDYVEAGGAISPQPNPPSPRASTPHYSPRPKPPCPPSIDEVLQNSVRGFREPWWKNSCSPHADTDANEDAARADEAGDCFFGAIGGGDMPPETKAFLDEHVIKPPCKSSRTRSATLCAIEGQEQRDEDMCLLLPSPSATHAATTGASHSSFKAEDDDTERAQAEATTGDKTGDIDMWPLILTGGSLPEPTDNYHGMVGSSILAGFSSRGAVKDSKNCDMSGSISPEKTPESVDNNYDVSGPSILAAEGSLEPMTTDNDKDNMAESFPPARSSRAFVSSTTMFSVRNTTCFKTLSVVEEEDEEESEVLLHSQAGSSSSGSSSSSSSSASSRSSRSSSILSQGVAFPPVSAAVSATGVDYVVETVIKAVTSVAHEKETRLGEEPDVILEYEDVLDYEGDDERSAGGSISDKGDDHDGLLFQPREEEGGDEEPKNGEDDLEEDENEEGREHEEGEGEGQKEGEEEVDNPLPLPVPAVVASANDERSSMTNRLVRVLRSLTDRHVAARGEYLARNCALSRCETNTDLTWLKVLGQGKFGRVSLVEHRLGRYALKELTEEAGEDEQWCARNEMETMLSVSHHDNIIQVVAMDPTLPSMPILMEAGSGDMFDVIYDADISMQTKISLLLEAAWGLEYLHVKGKVHRDVKAANVIVVGGDGGENSLTAKVADFGMTCDVGTLTPARTGSPGFIPVENLSQDIEAGPDGDVFSFGVLMLMTFLRPSIRVNNIFSHPLLLTAAERREMVAIHTAGWDKQAVFEAQCAVKERTLTDGSFHEIMLLPERLDDSMPNKSRVCKWLRRCLSADRRMRPPMEAVADMLEDLLDFED